MTVSDSLKKKVIPALALLAVLLLVSACSSTRFFYNRLDFFIPWYLDDYVDLDDRQDDTLDALLVEYLQRHRQTYLPRYEALLAQMLKAIDDPLTLEEVAAIYAQLDAEVTQLQDDTLRWMLVIGEELSEQQLAEFRRNLEKQQHDYEAEYLSRDETAYRREVFEGLKDSYSDYLGRLQPAQIQVLHATADRIRRLDDCWLDMRRYRLLKLETILRREPGWQARVQELMDDPTIPGALEYKKRYRDNLNIIFEATIAVINSRNRKQDLTLRSRLNDLRGDLLALNQQGTSQQGEKPTGQEKPGDSTPACEALSC